MAIQVRRGLEADFDASKMLPGEWAVSTDTRYVRMCFAPGIVLRMATYESFEADKAQIQAILAECKDIKSAIQRIQSEVNAKAVLVAEYANAADKSAKNAKQSEEKAKMYAENAAAVTGIEIAKTDRAGIIKGGENYIAEDGTLTLTMETNEKTLQNSHLGGIKVDEIGGKSEQNGVPTPDSPQEIKKVVLTGAKSVSGNFMPQSEVSGTMYKRITVDIPIGEYHVSAYVTSSDTNSTKSAMVFNYDDGTTNFLYLSRNERAKSQVELEKNVTSINFYASADYSSSDGDTFTFKDIMISVEDLDFVPRQESSITFTNPITLNGIGDVKDLIVRKDGVCENGKKFADIDLSTLTWTYSESLGVFTSSVLPVASLQKASGLCTHYMVVQKKYSALVSGEMVVRDSAVSGNSICIVKDTNYTDAELFKSAISGAVLVYEVEKPTFEPLPTADQIALNSLLSFDGVTHIYFDSEIEPTSLLEYGTSRVGALTLEAWNKAENNRIRTEEMTTALLMMNKAEDDGQPLS